MAGITAKDIAAKLGISPSAVSLALNGKPGVSESTRSLVLETAMQMGYVRAETAPAHQSSKTICFVRYAGEIVSIAEHTSFSSFVLQGVESRATELGTDIVEDRLPEIEQLFESMDNTPIVVVDSFLLDNRVDCVGNDSFGGAKSATEYLIQTGHRHIGYVRAKQRIRNLMDRQKGVQAALDRAGLSLDVLVDVDVSSEGAFQDFDAWIKGHPSLPDAIFAENDILAAAVIRVLKKHGYQVPGDVSVVGFDDIPVCEMLDPPLSTVHSFKNELGIVAVEHLHRRIVRGEIPHKTSSIGLLRTTLSTKFISRFSVKQR